jgi:hypothetical protein
MEALKDRIENLIFEFKYSFNPNVFKKETFHLDYDSKIYRQDELIKIIRDTITHFALTPEEFSEMANKGDIGEMQRISWSRISKANKFKKGDYGELILFIILSVFYDVPKFVTKVRLRSSVKEQIKGFDCAHFTIEKSEPVLWLGEAKFHKTFSGALTDALKSIKDHFEKAYLENEISILYSNVEANKNVDLAVLKKVLRGKSLDDVKFRVPILLTYDSDVIQNNTEIKKKFEDELKIELDKLNTSIEGKKIKLGSNIELLFIIFPLHSVATIKGELEKIESVSR